MAHGSWSKKGYNEWSCRKIENEINGLRKGEKHEPEMRWGRCWARGWPCW